MEEANPILEWCKFEQEGLTPQTAIAGAECERPGEIVAFWKCPMLTQSRP